MGVGNIPRGKNVENRTWETKYRGLLYIHASQKYNKQAVHYIKENFNIIVPPKTEMEYGVIIGCVTLTDIKPSLTGWAIPNNSHWLLENPKLIQPLPAKGRLGLWKFKL